MKSKAPTLCALAALAANILFGASTVAQAANAATIDGRVISTSGATVSGVSLELDGSTSRETTVSDSSGLFAFTNLPEGTYSIVATAKQFQRAASAPFQLSETQVLKVTVVLQPISTTSIATLGRVTVTGQQTLTNPAASTVVIGNDLFVINGDLNMQHTLDKIPGLTLDYSGNGNLPGGSTYVAFRGAGTEQTQYENLILEDGEPVTTSEGGLNLEALTPAIYSRVEVNKGPGGTSLFGADAVGGTLNLVTRDPLRKEGGQLLLSAGEWETSDINLVESNTFGRFGYLFDIHSFNTDGYGPNQKYDFAPFSWYFAPPSSYTPATAMGALAYPSQLQTLRDVLTKFRYDFSPASYSSITFSDTNDYHPYVGIQLNPAGVIINGVEYTSDPYGYPYATTGDPGVFFTDSQPKYAAEFHTLIGGGTLSLRAYDQYVNSFESGTDIPAVLGGPGGSFLFTDHFTGQLASFTRQFGKHTLTASVGGHGEHYLTLLQFTAGKPVTQGINGGELRQIEREYLLRDDYQANAKLGVTLSSYYSDFDTLAVRRFDPRLAVKYQPSSDESLTASVSSGFAPPSLADRAAPLSNNFAFNSPLCPTSEPLCVASSGNPDVQAETAIGVDLGYQRAFDQGAGNFGITLYTSNLKQHIFSGYVPAPPGLKFCCGSGNDGAPVLFLEEPINIVRSVYTGVETALTVPLIHDVSLDGIYDIQRAYPVGAPVAQEQLLQSVVNYQQYIFIPIHKEVATLRYGNSHELSSYVTWTYYDKNNSLGVGPFSTYDAGISVPLGENMLHVSLVNIFDRDDLRFQSYPDVVPGGIAFTGPKGAAYPGFSGPFYEYVSPLQPHTILVTFEHRWGTLR